MPLDSLTKLVASVPIWRGLDQFRPTPVVGTVALSARVRTSWGAKPARSREYRYRPSDDVPASTKLYAPFPETRAVTSNSCQPVATAPLSSRGPPRRAGRLFHVMLVSDQAVPVA